MRVKSQRDQFGVTVRRSVGGARVTWEPLQHADALRPAPERVSGVETGSGICTWQSFGDDSNEQ